MDKQMTVPEVQRRILENMVLLGPVVSRWQHEVMDPMLTRMYYEAGRQGLLPKIPEILRGRDFAPVYLSPLAKAQRASAIGDIQGFLQVIGGIAQFDPQISDKIDKDKTVDIIADLMGVNPQILMEDNKIKEIRDKRAELAKLQMQMQGAQAGADIDETAGKAKMHNAKAAAAK